MSKFELVDINSVERNRLIALGVDPRGMKALQATENWDYPDGIHTIASGTRGGLVDRKTNIGWKGWVEEGSVAIDSVINSFVEGDSVIRNSHLDVSRAVYGVTMSDSSAFGAVTGIMNSTLEGTSIRDSNITSSQIIGSEVTRSQISASTIEQSKLRDCTIDESNVQHMDLVSQKMQGVHHGKPMSHDERMDKTFEAMCDRAIGFYGDGPNISHRSEKVLEFTNPDNIYDVLHIAREVIDNTAVLRVKHATKDKTTTRILVEDPEDFRAMPRDNSLMFVKSTAPLNALIRSFNPELAVAVEVEQKAQRIEALPYGRDLNLNSGDLDDLESSGNTLGE